MTPLFWRALLAFLILPGTFAFAIPLILLRPAARGDSFDVLALIPLSLGIVLLLWCVREFYVAGKGTLAPWSPPKELVVTGPYSYSRNPMFIAILLILSGWALGFHSRTLAIYVLAGIVAVQLRVVLGEEPWLGRAHGDKWIRYKAQVPRWVGLRHARARLLLAFAIVLPYQSALTQGNTARVDSLLRVAGTPWFDVALVMTLFAVGGILFGRFEEHKSRWRRILKLILVTVIVVAVATTVGRVWAYALLLLPLLGAAWVHLWWLPKHGINGWTGEPRDKYLALMSRKRHRP